MASAPPGGLHRPTFGSSDWQELLSKHFPVDVDELEAAGGASQPGLTPVLEAVLEADYQQQQQQQQQGLQRSGSEGVHQLQSPPQQQQQLQLQDQTQQQQQTPPITAPVGPSPLFRLTSDGSFLEELLKTLTSEDDVAVHGSGGNSNGGGGGSAITPIAAADLFGAGNSPLPALFSDNTISKILGNELREIAAEFAREEEQEQQQEEEERRQSADGNFGNVSLSSLLGSPLTKEERAESYETLQQAAEALGIFAPDESIDDQGQQQVTPSKKQKQPVEKKKRAPKLRPQQAKQQKEKVTKPKQAKAQKQAEAKLQLQQQQQQQEECDFSFPVLGDHQAGGIASTSASPTPTVVASLAPAATAPKVARPKAAPKPPIVKPPPPPVNKNKPTLTLSGETLLRLLQKAKTKKTLDPAIKQRLNALAKQSQELERRRQLQLHQLRQQHQNMLIDSSNNYDNSSQPMTQALLPVPQQSGPSLLPSSSQQQIQVQQLQQYIATLNGQVVQKNGVVLATTLPPNAANLEFILPETGSVLRYIPILPSKKTAATAAAAREGGGEVQLAAPPQQQPPPPLPQQQPPPPPPTLQLVQQPPTDPMIASTQQLVQQATAQIENLRRNSGEMTPLMGTSPSSVAPTLVASVSTGNLEGLGTFNTATATTTTTSTAPMMATSSSVMHIPTTVPPPPIPILRPATSKTPPPPQQQQQQHQHQQQAIGMMQLAPQYLNSDGMVNISVLPSRPTTTTTKPMIFLNPTESAPGNLTAAIIAAATAAPAPLIPPPAAVAAPFMGQQQLPPAMMMMTGEESGSGSGIMRPGHKRERSLSTANPAFLDHGTAPTLKAARPEGDVVVEEEEEDEEDPVLRFLASDNSEQHKNGDVEMDDNATMALSGHNNMPMNGGTAAPGTIEETLELQGSSAVPVVGEEIKATKPPPPPPVAVALVEKRRRGRPSKNISYKSLKPAALRKSASTSDAGGGGSSMMTAGCDERHVVLTDAEIEANVMADPNTVNLTPEEIKAEVKREKNRQSARLSKRRAESYLEVQSKNTNGPIEQQQAQPQEEEPTCMTTTTAAGDGEGDEGGESVAMSMQTAQT